MSFGARFGTVLAIALSTIFISRPSHADWSDRKFVLEGMTGFGTPVGLLGVVARVDPIPWLSVGGGVGASTGGVEYAGIALGRIPFKARPEWLTAVTLGGSYSVGGRYHHNPNPSCWVEDCRDRWVNSSYELADAHWISGELGLEARSRKGLSLRGFLGLATLTNPGSVTCENYDKTTNDWLPGPCTAPLSDAASSEDLFPDISGPPGRADIIWVLGGAVGYAI